MYHTIHTGTLRSVGDRCRIHRIESTLAQKLSCQFLNSVVSKAVGRAGISMYDLFLGALPIIFFHDEKASALEQKNFIKQENFIWQARRRKFDLAL